MTEFELRPMTRELAPGAAALEQATFTEPWSTAAFLAEAEREQSHYFVALRQGEVVGFAGMQQVLDEFSVTNVAVAPDCRRQGLGRALMLRLLRVCRERQAAFLTLEVRAGNTAAIRLYQQLGFVEEGRRRSFYRLPVEDALLLTARPPFAREPDMPADETFQRG